MGIAGRHSATVAQFGSKHAGKIPGLNTLGQFKYGNRFLNTVYALLKEHGDIDFEKCKQLGKIPELRMHAYEEVREAMIIEGELKPKHLIEQDKQAEKAKREEEKQHAKPPPPLPRIIPVEPINPPAKVTKTDKVIKNIDWMNLQEVMDLSFADYLKRFDAKEVSTVFYNARATRLKHLMAKAGVDELPAKSPKTEKRKYTRRSSVVPKQSAQPAQEAITLVGKSFRQLAEIDVGELSPEQRKMVKGFTEKVVLALLKDKSTEIKIRMMEDPPVMEIVKLSAVQD